MNPLPPAFDGSWLVAHRGIHDTVPENSLAALERAARSGLPAEFDVRRTDAGELIVFHDSTLDRMTDSTGPVAALSPGRRVRLGIPTLADALSAHPGALLIELKRSPADSADALVSGLRDAVRTVPSLSDRAILMSFDDAVLRGLNDLLSEFVSTRLIGGLRRLAHEPLRRALRRSAGPPTQTVGPTLGLLTPRAVARFHEAGTPVFSWTAKNARDVKLAARLNVDLCIADPFSGYEHFREGPRGHSTPPS